MCPVKCTIGVMPCPLAHLVLRAISSHHESTTQPIGLCPWAVAQLEHLRALLRAARGCAGARPRMRVVSESVTIAAVSTAPPITQRTQFIMHLLYLEQSFIHYINNVKVAINP